MDLSKLGHTKHGMYILALCVGAILCVNAEAEGDRIFTQDKYTASIQENAPPNTFIEPGEKMGIYLDNPDSGVRYKVVSGDSDDIFKAESVTVGNFCFLRLRTRTGIYKVINRERRKSYELTVRAVIKHRNGSRGNDKCTVNVKVEDANDLNPLFYPRSYSVEIYRDASLHTSIAQVFASDADEGVNGEVYYSFTKPTSIFAVGPTSGVVTLTQPLGDSEEDFYSLKVIAEDRGPSTGDRRRFDEADLNIKILEVNHPPEIRKQELPAAVEHSHMDIYAIIHVHDKDQGENGETFKPKIVSGDPDGYFTLVGSNQEYKLKFNKDLDREDFPFGFNLTIEVSDKGNPPQTSSLDLLIKIADNNDEIPEFEKEVYTVEIEECVPINTPLLFVTASDKDTGKNAQVRYSIKNGNEFKWFKINGDSGLISTKNILDFETKESVKLTVVGEDQGNIGSRKMSQTNVEIKLLDCNDNSPTFNESNIDIDISEGEPVGTAVYFVVAHDIDQNDNGLVSYSIANTGSVPFAIDHFTGQITTKELLDYDESKKRKYSLKIRASDWGKPFRRESEMMIKIRVKDENDNAPKFEKVNCSGYLSRAAKMGTELVTLSAIDYDAGNIITYDINGGNDDRCFEMQKSTGVITTKCIFTGYKIEKRSLIVIASDGKNTAEPTFVNITFVDNNRRGNNDAEFSCEHTRATEEYEQILRKITNNDNLLSESGVIDSQFMYNKNAPRFSGKLPNRLAVSEDKQPGYELWKFAGVDSDYGFSGLTQFVIESGDPKGAFKVDTYSGQLLVLGDLDREQQDLYKLQISVRDMGNPSKIATHEVMITITDYNDHAPVFSQDVYESTVHENTSEDAIIMKVVASDKDEGVNGVVSYSLVTDTPDFRVNQHTGDIIINSKLDRENKNEYELVVQATDGANLNPLSSTCVVKFHISDMNDNKPMFQPSYYNVRIREDMPVNSVVLILSAFDPDEGSGGEVRYTLIDGHDNRFDIDKETGVLRIIKPLDYERRQVYNITARARDRGIPSEWSKCLVTVEIIDVNENLYTPKFDNFVFQGIVKENSPKNSAVMRISKDGSPGSKELQVRAEDYDDSNIFASRADYDVSYSIIAGSGLGRFKIDKGGNIYTNDILDYETEPHYWLTVYATDHGTVPLSSRVEVYIQVENINDNIPQTREAVYYPNVEENSVQDTSVLQLFGYDMDDTDASDLTYTISSGNPQGFFKIDEKTGIISTTSRKLDREDQSEHILEVYISDGNLSSSTRVVVNVDDVNDETPRFTESIYRVRIPHTEQEPTQDIPLYRVVAHDKDLGANAEVVYSVDSSQSQFQIDPVTGVVFSRKEFKVGETFELMVTATDRGLTPRQDFCRVIFEVVERPKESLNPPRFTVNDFNEDLFENDRVGTMVMLIQAEDPDGDRIWYNIIAGNTDNTFAIDSEDGTITLAKPLDWETTPHYNMTVQVTDTVHSITTPVVIHVIDTNDNAPEFSKVTYEVTISESITPGAEVLTVAANDKDQDKRMFFTIHSAMDPASHRLFKINSESDIDGEWKGVITVQGPLDHESASRHELTIMVRDHGTPSKHSLARVIIYVEDHNDHKPEFLADEFHGQVYETAPVGSQVLQVVATDRDRAINAEIKYSISSGNIGNTFRIDETMGTIHLQKELDKHSPVSYSLVVKASDLGSPSLSATVPVYIEITMSDNAPPKFSQDEYTTELHENQPQGTFILAISAISKSSLTYEITAGNEKDMFKINPNSGVLFSNSVFDYEETEFFNLTVSATNMASAVASASVLVHIVDENDNSPVFIHTVFIGHISEASPPGSVVLDKDHTPLVIKAVDADDGVNELVSYTIIEPAAKTMFSIDENTGAIKTVSSLDHEKALIHEFSVSAYDMGTPRKTALYSAVVTIHVQDVNDSPPKFKKDEFTATILMPTFKDIVVLQLEASDADTEINSTLEYSKLSGDEENIFYIDRKTGSINVAKPENMRDSYTLEVQVSDGKYTSTAQVIIEVDIIQIDGLRFQKDEYFAMISENSSLVQNVMAVQTLGQGLNEPLEFSILNENDMFTIGETSGVIQTTGAVFDREKRDKYKLIVEVRDNRPIERVAHVELQVSVIDINDNAPVFVERPYYSSVSIHASIGDVVSSVIAVDRDVGKNGKIIFTLLKGGEGKFTVNEKSGEIIVRKKLREMDQHTKHVLKIRATDQGSPQLDAETTVSISIMNDATPIFKSQYYSVDIPENVQLYTAILTIEATSPTGKKLIYSIHEGNVFGEFAVDFNTGSLTVIDSLDYETEKTYELTVRVTDAMSGAFSDAVIHVNVQDVNDNSPSFSSYVYVSTLSEVAPVGTSVLTVTAADKDTGTNSDLLFSIIPHNNLLDDSRHFKIDPHTGTVLTKLKLDHEHSPMLQFTVLAQDQGVPSLSATVLCKVRITDINDNTPQFDQPSYQVTITDQIQRGQFVTMVTATDDDITDAENLSYSIVGGNIKQTFMIAENTGAISLSSLRQPDLQASYLLNVSVTDGVFKSFTRVEVKVEMTNGHEPVFSHPLYDADVAENVEPGVLVTVVTATDSDLGVYGELLYDIDSEQARQMFSIEPETGTIHTKVSLDREAKRTFELTVVARDGGGRAGYTTVRVNVQDKGDQRPQFSMVSYQANVRADAEKGSSVIAVQAVDLDLGSNADIDYSLYDKDNAAAAEYFIITADGDINTKASLQSLESELFQFFIRATDKGSPPKHSEVPVEILVIGAEDKPPAFDAPSFEYFISEDKEPASVIATVTASYNDTLVYSLVSGELPYTNNPPVFSINENGKILLQQELDRETIDSFELNVKAETTTSPPLVAYTRVTIKIMDVNDNYPSFESNPYTINVIESIEVGSQLFQVQASDKDTGINADITYGFAPSSNSLSAVFSIDSDTGWISTLVPLDREKKDSYTFVVRASDKGAHVTLRDETTVEVTVFDQNDEPPKFSQARYQGAVHEDALPGTVVITVSTSDGDLGDNARVAYYITSGDPYGLFSVRDTGEVYVKKALDWESKEYHQLEISATDGAFITTAEVSITILDANDNAPECQQHMHEILIAENVPVGTFIVQVVASDKDDGSTKNGQISYSLKGESVEMFAMHKRSGVLSTIQPLDREAVEEHRLHAIATDGGGLSCTMELFIHLTDVNDNAPKFNILHSSITIPEDAKIGTLLTRVAATDDDLGINQQVKYAMLENGGHFIIDEMSGIIRVNKTLDRESKPTFNLTLYAHDQGTPKLTSTWYIEVVLLDINDNIPEFDQSVYTTTVAEDIAVGASVLTMYAFSRDTGDNAKISYSIIAGNELDKFAIDPNTGVIVTKAGLDYERSHEIILTIEAKDQGVPPLSQTAVVHVNVSDVNDCAPVFSQESYTVSVHENVPTNEFIIQVHAFDDDSPANADVTYHIVTGSETVPFSINLVNGTVFVSEELDREDVESYDLEIHALDSGSPQLTGSVHVYVTVLDINDNPPMFTQHNYTAVVQVDDAGVPFGVIYGENREFGHSILTLEVEDADLEPNGAPFSFDIVDGNSNNEFLLSRDGALSTTTTFNREIKDLYILTVKVYDAGTPVLFSETTVNVRIIEESSTPPIVTPLSINVMGECDTFTGGSIGRVKAIDRDPFDRLSYAIVSDNSHLFEVDAFDGTLSASQPIDGGDYNINVSVSDTKFIVYTAVELTVNTVCDNVAQYAVVMRFQNIVPEEFVSSYLDTFVDAIKAELAVRAKDVAIISIQPASNPYNKNRNKRAVGQDLDVMFAIKKSQNNYWKGNKVQRRLNRESKKNIEETMGVKIVKILNDVCDLERLDCGDGYCETDFKLDVENAVLIVTDSESYVTPKHELVATCHCPQGYTGIGCKDLIDLCSPDPCPASRMCDTDGITYQCVCPNNQVGPQCTAQSCPDPDCYDDTPISFSGDSYAAWQLTVAMDRRLILSLNIKTIQNTAILMYAMGSVDYSKLELIDGYVQYSFDCGSGRGLARVNNMPVNDGKWHLIEVERISQRVNVVIDGTYEAHGDAPGTNDVLNIDKRVFFGAQVQVLPSDYVDIRNGYIGCMNDIKIEKTRLPVQQDVFTPVGQLFKLHQIEEHCANVGQKGVCSSSPCQHGGSCVALGHQEFMCNCRGRFIGSRCEVDPNPCISNPCLNRGTCIAKHNDFQCMCIDKMSGRFCEPITTCHHNPCQNSGKCVTTGSRPQCHCSPGFTGEVCEENVNECLESPCVNGGTCVDTIGSYRCMCPDGSSGHTCEMMILSDIRSSPHGIELMEIIIIIGAAVGLLLLVLITVLIIRWRRKKTRAKQEAEIQERKLEELRQPMFTVTHNDTPSPSVTSSHHRRNIPPPVPTRPASYTPSNADSMNTLSHGNFDAARDYGSAGDDLEIESLKEPIQIPDFLTRQSPSLNSGRSPPPPPRKYDSTFRNPMWDPNINENYPDKSRKMDNKAIPSEAQSQQSLQLLNTENVGASISSLPVSEIDDDMSGYHWDTTDWKPRRMRKNQGGGVAAEPLLRAPSDDSNIHIDTDDYAMTDGGMTDGQEDDGLDNEQSEVEYVGETDYEENEMGDEDLDFDFNPEHPNYQQYMTGDFQQYLPSHQLSDLDSSQQDIDFRPEENGNDNIPMGADAYIHYGFPFRGRNNKRPIDNRFSGDFSAVDSYQGGMMSELDDRSVTMSGYDSANVSQSDIAGLCQFEDSEFAVTDAESDDDNTSQKVRVALLGQTSTDL